MHNGLWLKALEQAEGNKEKQIAEYIKLRVQSLKDDISIYSDSGDSNNGISHKRDIEGFVTMLNGNVSIVIIEDYFSGMYSLVPNHPKLIAQFQASSNCPVREMNLDRGVWTWDALFDNTCIQVPRR